MNPATTSPFKDKHREGLGLTLILALESEAGGFLVSYRPAWSNNKLCLGELQ